MTLYFWGDDTLAYRSPAQARIDSFADLKAGWHYGSGIAPTQKTRERASSILERMQMLGLTSVHASAGPDGEILLAATAGQNYVSITIENESTFTFNHEYSGTEVEYEEEIGLRDLIRKLTTVAGAVWNISGLSIRDLSIANDVNSMTWLSKSPPIAECQFLKWNAPQQLVA